MAKRARLSVEEVVLALDESSLDDEFDDDEPMMEGSDEEFGEFDEELREQIEIEEEESDDGKRREQTCTEPSDDGACGIPATSPGDAALPTDWTHQLTSVHIPAFSSPTGPTLAVPDTPLGAFQLFFTGEILDYIAHQTNLYAGEVLEGKAGECKYRAVTVEELMAYLGFCILMAVNHLPEVEDYWRRDKVYHYSPIASRISRERFREISRYLHFVDNSTLLSRDDPAYDRLQKIRPLIRHISTQFQAVYNPHREYQWMRQ